MSLGGTDGWTESSSSVLSSRIAASGRIVTIAAGTSRFPFSTLPPLTRPSPTKSGLTYVARTTQTGNDGSKGSWYTSGPGNAINAISVASLDNTVIPLQNATVHGAAHDPIPYFDTFPLPINGTLPVFATSNDTAVVDDACDPLPDDTPDLSGFVVVVRRGTCTFVSDLDGVCVVGRAAKMGWIDSLGPKVDEHCGQGRPSQPDLRVRARNRALHLSTRCRDLKAVRPTATATDSLTSTSATSPRS